MIAGASPILWGFITTLLSGGFITAFVAIRRARPERDNIVISSAANAQEIFRGLNEALYAELERERRKLTREQRWVAVLEDELRANGVNVPYERRSG